MPLVYALSDLSDELPPTLTGVLDTEVYRTLVRQIKEKNSNGCCLGACFVMCCTLVLGPIGFIIGLCSCPIVWSSYSNEHANLVCNNTNQVCYGGRRIYEWHEDGTLWIYPENRFDTIVTVEPINTQAVFVQDAYYVTPTVVQAYSPSANSHIQNQNVVIVQEGTLTPLQIHQANDVPPPYHQNNNSYQPPPAAASAPSDVYIRGSAGNSNNV